MPQTPIDTPDDSPPPLRGMLIRGSIWMMAMRWFMRFIGLISTAILARLLLPQDFGLVAMAMVFVGLLQQLLDFGLTFGLLRNPDADRRHYDTTWTVQLIQMSGVASILALSAPVIAGIYDEPRVTDIVLVVALGVAIRGWENIGVIDFRKHLQFRKDFQFNVLIKIGGFLLTISLAWVLRSYWALVLGVLFNQVTAVGLSYLMSPYRPRFSLAVVSEIWSFSQWMLVRGLANYVFARGDEFLIGKLFSSTGMGLYTVAKDLSRFPINEVVQPLSRAITPGFAKLQNDPVRLSAAFMKTLEVLALLIVPMGVGLACIAVEIVPLLLGEKWLDAIPFVQLLPVASVILALNSPFENLIVVLGHVRALALNAWLRAFFMIICVFVGYELKGMIGIIEGVIIGNFIALLLLFRLVVKEQVISWSEIFRLVARPVAAAGGMAAVLLTVMPLLGLPPAILLMAKVVVGVLVYGFVLLASWWLPGGRSAIERDLFDAVRRKLSLNSVT